MDANNPRTRDIILLLALSKQEEISVSNLAAKLNHTLSKVSIIKKYPRLTREGYIEKRRQHQEVYLKLSDTGKDLVNKDIQPFEKWLKQHGELFETFINQSEMTPESVSSDDIVSSLREGTFLLVRFLLTLGQGAVTRTSFVFVLLGEGIEQIRREFEVLQKRPQKLKELVSRASEKFPMIAELMKEGDLIETLNKFIKP